MLIRSLGRLHLYTAFTCTISVPEALWRRGVATGITKRPDSEIRTANSVRAFSCVKDLRSLVKSLSSGRSLPVGRPTPAISLSGYSGSMRSHCVVGVEL